MAFCWKYFGAWKWTTKLMQMLQFYESTIMMSMENINSLEITVNWQIYELAPPHAYKLSMLFWSTTLAYSSRNIIVGISFISPAWKKKKKKKKRSHMKFIIYIYIYQTIFQGGRASFETWKIWCSKVPINAAVEYSLHFTLSSKTVRLGQLKLPAT